MTHSATALPQDYDISTAPNRLDIDVIHRFLSQDSYWARDIPRAVVERSLANSLCFGLYHRKAQVGLARVVTDQATFALLADVFILPPHRGMGLSKQLMRAVMEHHDLKGLRRLLLLTSDAHSLYSQFGFEPLGSPARFMEALRPDAYRTPADPA